MTAKNGIQAKTHERILMGPGAVYIGVAGTQLLGATSGGNVLEINRTFMDIRPDGARGKTKGYRILKSVEAILTVRLMEVTEQIINYALAGSSLAAHVITGGEIVADTYIDKITIAAEVKGVTPDSEANAVKVELTNCLVEGPLTINLPENDEVKNIELKFHAHFDPSALTTEPWSIAFTPVPS
jgi:hypothetical protein